MVSSASSRRGEIDRLVALLDEANLTLLTRPTVVLRGRDQAVTRVTWAPSGQGAGSLFRGRHPGIDEYRDWIAASAFGAVLYDGALLQLTYDYEHADLVGHRLVYYPCPFELASDLVDDLGLLDVIDMHVAGPGPGIRLGGPLRFDYDAGAPAGHPSSHLTLISNDCRWAVTSPLSPGHFIRFIFRHFYRSLFDNLRFLREWPIEEDRRTIAVDEENAIHVSTGRTSI